MSLGEHLVELRKRILIFVLIPTVILLGLGGYLHWRTYADAVVNRFQTDAISTPM